MEVLERILERIMRLWEWRLVEAATLEPAARRKELGAFGWWFAAEAFPEDWAIAQLERALTEGGGADADHLVAERIRTVSERYPREAVVCMRLMAAGDDEGWGIIGWRDEARSAITTAMASGNADARAAAEALVNYLGTRGHLEFRDLLPHPPV
ncbi:MAG: hypothetical protein M3285_00940 [Actinomycetota bacterium]|nr:hypothetical protein [Actinomycetota bacterium]MDQ3954101.1 hypothetical protein [Actinomycetota bacterium]